MKKILILSAVAALVASCSSGLGTLTADNFSVTPSPLVSDAGQVPASIAGTFPEKFMKKKAVVTATPELRATDGSLTVQGNSMTFQGEKVAGNGQTVSYRLGGRYTMNSLFTYDPALLESELYMTFTAKVKSKSVSVPEVKIANGVIATSELYKQTLLADGGCWAKDAFERVTMQKQEANIKFLVNQAEIRKSELQSNSVHDFVAMLQQINNDQEHLLLQNIEIQAYASPEGGYDYNNKLSAKRQDATEKYVDNTLTANKMSAAIDAHYTAQDWEGFKQLVAVSNIQDKDVIIRVLEMYKDPEEREQQIRNVGAGYEELTTGILPELRRSRMIINYETIGKSDEELLAAVNSNANSLSVEELLYTATLVDNSADKKAIYKQAARLYSTDGRALNNLACLAMQDGDTSAAKSYIAQALSADSQLAEAVANRGLLALVDGDKTSAEADIAKATTLGDVSYAQGVLDIAKGNYSSATSDFGSKASNSAALAQILNKNYTSAISTLDSAEAKGATNNYLHAVAAARRSNKFATSSYYDEAAEASSFWADYGQKDLELSIIH